MSSVIKFLLSYELLKFKLAVFFFITYVIYLACLYLEASFTCVYCWLQMDGFVLPSFESSSIIRDKDIIRLTLTEYFSISTICNTKFCLH